MLEPRRCTGAQAENTHQRQGRQALRPYAQQHRCCPAENAHSVPRKQPQSRRQRQYSRSPQTVYGRQVRNQINKEFHKAVASHFVTAFFRFVTVQSPHDCGQTSIPNRLRRWDFCLQTYVILRPAQQVRRSTEQLLCFLYYKGDEFHAGSICT